MCDDICNETTNGKIITRRDYHFFMLFPLWLPHAHPGVCARCGTEPSGACPVYGGPASLLTLAACAGTGRGGGVSPVPLPGELTRGLQPHSHESPAPPSQCPCSDLVTESGPCACATAVLPGQGGDVPRSHGWGMAAALSSASQP